jgi:hypothetical protein
LLKGGAQIGVQLNRNQGNIADAKGEIETAKQKPARVKLQLRRDLANMFRHHDPSRVTVQEYKKPPFASATATAKPWMCRRV